jgi:hypothetical protein
MKETLKEFDMYFGSSKLFRNIFKKAALNNIDFMREPIFATILSNLSLGQYLCLKKKSHIFVEKSCVNIGIPDGFGILKEGEVFSRVQRETSQDYKTEIQEQEIDESGFEAAFLGAENKTMFAKVDIGVGSGVVKAVVTKNPCSHPGDIRVMEVVSLSKVKDRITNEKFNWRGPVL